VRGLAQALSAEETPTPTPGSFETADTDGDGCISEGEFQSAMESTGKCGYLSAKKCVDNNLEDFAMAPPPPSPSSLSLIGEYCQASFGTPPSP